MSLPPLKLSGDPSGYTLPNPRDQENDAKPRNWWTRSADTVETADQISWYSDQWSSILREGLGIEDPDQEWYAVRPLGEGGYGWAVLYERRSRSGEVIDVGLLPLLKSM